MSGHRTLDPISRGLKLIVVTIVTAGRNLHRTLDPISRGLKLVIIFALVLLGKTQNT